MAFPSKCNPRVINVDPSCGCSLTRASITSLTPQGFEDQGAKEIYMDRVIKNAQMAKATGYRENGLDMLLMGRLTGIKGELTKQSIRGTGSVILPYIYRRQKNLINANYWEVVSATANASAGVGSVHPGAWDITLKNNQSTLASALVDIEKYFLPGKTIWVEWVASNVAYRQQLKITASVNADSGGVERATVTVEPPVSAAAWAAYSAAQKAAYQPTAGLVMNGPNNVTDYESWCHNGVAVNNLKLLTYWMQTSRFTHCYNEEYLKALNGALMSGYWTDFRQLPLAEQRRQQYAQFMRELQNGFFYGQAIDENQTVEGYTNLPIVYDPANPTCPLEYKANALGIHTQLNNCGRVFDHQGNSLNLDSLFETLYYVKRAREADGGSIDRIDVGTDRFTSGQILQIMTTFYKAKYGVATERQYRPDQQLTHENQVLLNYNVYQLPSDVGGFELCVWTHPFFDDKLAAQPTAQKSRGRVLWGVDWSDVQLGIAGTNKAKRRTNEADNLYNCVIKPVISHYDLESTTWCPIVEDPNRHWVVENFSNDVCPQLTVAGCSV